MGNLGKVKIRATVGGELQGMLPDSNRSVNDLSANDAYQHFLGSQQGSSPEIEFISDQTSGSGMVIPIRKHAQIANYMSGVTSTTSVADPRIIWNVLPKDNTADLSRCVGSSRIEKLITNKSQVIVAPSTSTGSTMYPDSYVGPRWSTPRGAKKVTPPDTTVAAAAVAAAAAAATTTPSPDDFSTAFVSQDAVCQDIWWSAETTSMSATEIPDGTPFYVEVCFSRPLASQQPTFFALRVGDLSLASSGTSSNADTSTREAFELIFIDGKPNAMLYDLGMIEERQSTSSTGAPITTIGPVEVALPGNIAWDGNFHKIEFIPLAGRLFIRIDNQWSFLYTRVDKSAVTSFTSTAPANGALTKGSILFFPKYNQIRAIGSNSQATMMLGQVYFSERATLHTNMPAAINAAMTVADQPLDGTSNGLPVADGGALVPNPPPYSQLPDANVVGPMVAVPGVQVSGPGTANEGAESQAVILGAFAKTCKSVAGILYLLTAIDFWGSAASGKMHGSIEFALEDDKTGTPQPDATLGKHHTITLVSERGKFGKGTNSPARTNLCPVWFRARGSKSVATLPEMVSDEKDVSDDVIEISDSFTSPDRYHITHSLDIVLYNENGQYDYLAEKSYPIRVGFIWGSDETAVVNTGIFTGIIINGSKSLVAGKETISFHCEDYMFILEATLIINSPYYDGMDGYNIIRDLVAKANLQVIDNTGSIAGERFFVPSCYSFLEPAKRYDPKSSVKECVLDVCTMGAKVVWFDGDGMMHYDRMQGAIGFTMPASGIEVLDEMKFVSDPALATADTQIILDEKRTEVKLNSIVNRIFIKAIDRTTRAVIFASGRAPVATNALPYKKVMYYSIPSLGSFKAVLECLERLKRRVFCPIRGITVKVSSSFPFTPMLFFSVDDEKFRLMGVNRSIRIEDNSIIATLTGEWMGARQF